MDARSATDPIVVFNQEKIWPFVVATVRQPLYLVVQLLERREEYYEMEESSD